MKAIIYHEFGDVEVLRYEDTDVPEVDNDEVLVRVRASSINSLDLRLRSGKSPRPVDLPHVGGIDISGDIESVGSDVSSVKQGDRVVVNPTIKLGKSFKVIGVNLWGGFADYVKVPETNVVKIPDKLSYNDASALPVCYVTAVYGLVNRSGLKAGETIVVHAAGSGTGSAAVQVAKHLGARVIATAGNDDKLEKAKQIGADETVNYNTSDFAEVIKGGVDIVFDQVGASFWDRNLKILNSKGRLLLVGVVGGGMVENVNLGPMIMKDISVLGVTMFNAPQTILEEVVKLAVERKIQPVIDKAFPLSRASEAQKLLQNRQQFGKVILNP